MKSLMSQAKDWLLPLLYKRIILILLVLLIVGITITIASISRLSSSLIESQALYNAKLNAQTLQEARSLYTTEVVNRLEKLPEVTVSDDYPDKLGGIPLPITYFMLLSHRISEKNSAEISTRLYSRYPFSGRVAEKLKRDDFETAALEYLEKNPQEIFYRFEKMDGHLTLRYAEPDIMKPSCISCHNSHPDSPKTDWKVGQLRGVLEIKQPLDRIMTQSQNNLMKIYIYLFIFGTLAMGSLTVFITRFKLMNKKPDTLVKQLTEELNIIKTKLFNIHEMNKKLNTLVKQRTEELTTTQTKLFNINQQMTQLKIQVDQENHQVEVNKIINSDNFNWIAQQGNKWRQENLD